MPINGLGNAEKGHSALNVACRLLQQGFAEVGMALYFAQKTLGLGGFAVAGVFQFVHIF